ncbi:mandelate racemase/muconate lactonizing enzyme family protein [Methylibium sp.]|uniref:mandelate racemase/muconate lactonizing enzyme family protein n=1 Tax=Methylibium sp. TaxID=2067992 RepID=UPI0025FCEDEE|nr:mandelate racemase/muconate lactonizing enzyme family protein [Methylibium sp.]
MPQTPSAIDRALRIREVKAFPISFPIAPENSVALGMGRAVKKDAVVVKVTTEGGLVGWGEAHHGKAHTAVAQLINTTLRQLVLGMDASDVVGVWNRIYWKQLASHGVGAGCAMAMSGIDLALWDIRGKAVGWPLYKLLGGSARPVPAYAGGVSLGFQDPSALIDEARPHIEAGYKAVKLRVGDTPARDLQRVKAVREALGDDIAILVDANTGYDVNDARQVMPGFDALGVGWLEEPFAPHDIRSYKLARGFGRVPLAAGENHFTRFEFNRVIEDGDITILQPDLSKAGGITEMLRIAAMASAYKLPINPHTCMTGINMAASIHFLAAIDNGGYFEGDVSKNNLYRDQLTSSPFKVDADGNVRPLEAPGIGVEIDESFLAAYPPIEGPGYI